MTEHRKGRAPAQILGGIAVAVLLGLVTYLQNGTSVPVPAGAELGEPDHGVLERAHAERQSGVWMGVTGPVTRILADDNEGSRHQRFILQPERGPSLLIAHNIDLAPRIPLQTGDILNLYGRYEWNEKGGVIHWTHHDPQGREPGGWIEHQGKRYQ